MTIGSSLNHEVAHQYDALRSTAAAHVLPRDVLRVSGPDATSYLQGQCSQDVVDLAIGASADALLLSPQGKIDVLIRLAKVGADEFVIDTDAGYGTAVTARLERFRLRTKVDIEPLEWVCLAVRGPDSAQAIVGQPPLVAPVAWPGLIGSDLLGPAPATGPSAWVADQVVACGDEAWEAARIEAGVPVNGLEVAEGTTIAAEVGLVDRTVSFTKGCFTGQELVARLDSRGSKVARRLCGVVLDADTAQPGFPPSLVGAAVFTADGEHEVGHLSSVAWSPGLQSMVALATLHRRVEPPEGVLVRWQSGSEGGEAHAEARPLPLVG
jgi:folate-binding protein YgfZ